MFKSSTHTHRIRGTHWKRKIQYFFLEKTHWYNCSHKYKYHPRVLKDKLRDTNHTISITCRSKTTHRLLNKNSNSAFSTKHNNHPQAMKYTVHSTGKQHGLIIPSSTHPPTRKYSTNKEHQPASGMTAPPNKGTTLVNKSLSTRQTTTQASTNVSLSSG